MRWTDEVRIETPEQVEVDLELAGLGSRFVARFLDWLIQALFNVALFVLALAVAALAGLAFDPEHMPVLAITIALTLSFLVSLGYGTFYELKRNGQTPGKKVAGIRVVREGGGPIDFRAAAVRNMLTAIDLFPGLPIIGPLLVLLTTNRQRLGDLAAGTVVIRERVVELGADPTDELIEHAVDEVRFTSAQLAALAPNDRAILRELLRRLEEMDRAGARKLAVRMAENYAKKTGYPLAVEDLDRHSARAFLASLLRDLEEARRHG
jgi:uncharacterized RDD family membrane protein YckC